MPGLYHRAMAGRIVSPTLVGRATEMTALARRSTARRRGARSTSSSRARPGSGSRGWRARRRRLLRPRGFVVLQGGCADIGEGGVPTGRSSRRSARSSAASRPPGSRPCSGSRGRISPGSSRRSARPRAASPTEFLAPRLLDAILGVLQRLAETRPVLLVLEDLHWADAATREAVAFLVRQLRTDRVLLLMTFRDDELHRRHPLVPWLAELERSGRVERTVVSRLGSAETAELLASILGETPSAELAARVHRRSDGNPFFVEELVGAGPRAARSDPADPARGAAVADRRAARARAGGRPRRRGRGTAGRPRPARASSPGWTRTR